MLKQLKPRLSTVFKARAPPRCSNCIRTNDFVLPPSTRIVYPQILSIKWPVTAQATADLAVLKALALAQRTNAPARTVLTGATPPLALAVAPARDALARTEDPAAAKFPNPISCSYWNMCNEESRMFLLLHDVYDI
ncbi:hypothetical protein Agabi119p4_8451 [Agaricus bisporus var. burnettii]|uniref:Uncharacterized protein n=1 Tax=Agaricus bisporus var. burnettii TaxID=192524 RepID=A0A8H7C745_AGABI|nr:hypothetical protein Agabi119p4_8451 [Agaricus bisporus var. burnettii]